MDETRNEPRAAEAAEAAEAGLLIRGVRRGDREAFLTIIRLYQQKVFQMAYGFFKNREDALDIVQETFLRVHEKSGLFKEGCGLQGWILQIAKNLCIDFYRKNIKKRKELESRQSLDELNLPAPADPHSGRASDLPLLVGRCVDRLAQRQRLVFVMRHYQEFRNEDIARILNISTGTVKSLHFKAVQNLKTMLAPYWEAQS